MTVRVIEPSDWQTQAWKNGGGVTHEIWREELEGKIVFRLSVADVAADGPFSLFPSIDRHIHLLHGKGFRLAFNSGQTVQVDEEHCFHAFSGDEPVQCSLLDGSVQDFNLMTDRARVQARVSEVFLSGGSLKIDASANTFVLFIREGEIHAKLTNQVKPFLLAKQQTIIAQNEVGEVAVAEGKTGRFILAELIAKND